MPIYQSTPFLIYSDTRFTNDSHSLAWGDVDGDGINELLVSPQGVSPTEQPVFLRYTGAGFSDKNIIVSDGGFTTDSSISGFDIFDIDNDGQQEVMHYHASDPTNGIIDIWKYNNAQQRLRKTGTISGFVLPDQGDISFARINNITYLFATASTFDDFIIIYQISDLAPPNKIAIPYAPFNTGLGSSSGVSIRDIDCDGKFEMVVSGGENPDKKVRFFRLMNHSDITSWSDLNADLTILNDGGDAETVTFANLDGKPCCWDLIVTSSVGSPPADIVCYHQTGFSKLSPNIVDFATSTTGTSNNITLTVSGSNNTGNRSITGHLTNADNSVNLTKAGTTAPNGSFNLPSFSGFSFGMYDLLLTLSQSDNLNCLETKQISVSIKNTGSKRKQIYTAALGSFFDSYLIFSSDFGSDSSDKLEIFSDICAFAQTLPLFQIPAQFKLLTNSDIFTSDSPIVSGIYEVFVSCSGQCLNIAEQSDLFLFQICYFTSDASNIAYSDSDPAHTISDHPITITSTSAESVFFFSTELIEITDQLTKQGIFNLQYVGSSLNFDLAVPPALNTILPIGSDVHAVLDSICTYANQSPCQEFLAGLVINESSDLFCSDAVIVQGPQLIVVSCSDNILRFDGDDAEFTFSITDFMSDTVFIEYDDGLCQVSDTMSLVSGNFALQNSDSHFTWVSPCDSDMPTTFTNVFDHPILAIDAQGQITDIGTIDPHGICHNPSSDKDYVCKLKASATALGNFLEANFSDYISHISDRETLLYEGPLRANRVRVDLERTELIFYDIDMPCSDCNCPC